MVTAVSAYQNGLTRIYTNDDGSVTVLRGGSRAWRNNNPGNIKYGANAKAAGAIGKDSDGFAIFPDYQSGLQGIANVFTRKYGNSTIDQAMQGYAPPSENDTAGYIASLKNRGVPGNTLIRDFTPDQLDRLGDGIRSHEGWHPGTTAGPAANMGGPGSPVVTSVAVNQANPLQKAGVPIPDFAQTQAIEPAFDATSWLPRPAMPNALPPDAAQPFAGAPSIAPIPLMDETTRAQQALGNSLPAPGAAPWAVSDRFGTWDNVGGVSGPMRSGRSDGPGRAPSSPAPSVFDLGTAPISYTPDAAQEAPGGILGRLAQMGALDPSDPDQPPVGGLLALLQQYMRGNPDGGASR